MPSSFRNLIFDKYFRVPSERVVQPFSSSDETDEECAALVAPQRVDSNRWNSPKLHSVLTFSLLLNLCLMALLGWRLRRDANNWEIECLRSLMLPSPALESMAGTASNMQFDGAFVGTSKWRGPPSDEIDEQWESIIELGMIPLTNKQAKNMGIDHRGYVHIPGELQNKYGEGILVGMEFSHQLHCLNMIRKYIYFDYYNSKPSEISFNATRQVLHTHIEHCIDILRQVISCQPDTGFWPVYWVEGRDLAMPDFSTQHKCRSLDKVLGWARRHTLKESYEAKPGPDDVIWSSGQHPQTELWRK